MNSCFLTHFLSLTLLFWAVKPSLGSESPLTLTQGRFGNALNALASPVTIAGDDRYRKPPITVECWAKLNSNKPFNILVANDPKNSATHWEIYSYARTGVFAAYLPGYEPSEILSKVDICDRKWRHVGMQFDGQHVQLFVDGQQVVEQSVKPKTEINPIKGDLMIGMVGQGKQRIGCDGLIDEVRISNTLRWHEGRLEARLQQRPILDPNTIGLWRFDESEGAADPAWTPKPATGAAAAWEKETDADWVDARFREMDTGPFLNATITYPSWAGKRHAYKATAIKVGVQGQGTVLFDRNQLNLVAGWTGGYVRHGNRRFGLLNTPAADGEFTFVNTGGPGWCSPDGDWRSKTARTGPLPREWAKYRGLYMNRGHIVLSYSVGQANVLDMPWLEEIDGLQIHTRTIQLDSHSQPKRMVVCEFPNNKGVLRNSDDFQVALCKLDEKIYAVALRAEHTAPQLHIANGSRVEVHFPPNANPVNFKLWMWQGQKRDYEKFLNHVTLDLELASTQSWSNPGPPRWGRPLTTKGELSPNDKPYVIDTLTVPYENRFKALMFLTGVDSLPNGDLAVCTAHGDVWCVKGVDKELKRIEWKRFATGLYQPMGLKVIGGRIHILERGQLTRLHDVNRDGEADFYENINNDWHTGRDEHAYDTCLEIDPQGNFYFFVTGEEKTPTGGCLLRVSADGSKSEIFATGFRHPIGLGISPEGIITGADQEGNWMPATRIDQYRKGGFYGDMRTHHRKVPPKMYDEPLCWLPREMDNSAGGQVWAPREGFGPLSGRPIHFSYGRCKAMLMFRQEMPSSSGQVSRPGHGQETVAQQRVQGGAVDLGWRFLSGSVRGRFRPQDGALYVVGHDGWQTAALRDGSLQRVRYTGKKLYLPVNASITLNGVELEFSQPVNPATARESDRYGLKQWNYRWAESYGSERWSVENPEKVGEDTLTVGRVSVSPDGRKVVLKIPDLRPVMQLEIVYDIAAQDGTPMKATIYYTPHFVPGTQTGLDSSP